jgi:hypothetical protein
MYERNSHPLACLLLKIRLGPKSRTKDDDEKRGGIGVIREHLLAVDNAE